MYKKHVDSRSFIYFFSLIHNYNLMYSTGWTRPQSGSIRVWSSSRNHKDIVGGRRSDTGDPSPLSLCIRRVTSPLLQPMQQNHAWIATRSRQVRINLQITIHPSKRTLQTSKIFEDLLKVVFKCFRFVFRFIFWLWKF